MVELHVRARRGDICLGNYDDIEISAFQSEGRTYYSAEKLKFKQKEAGTLIEPFVSLDTSTAQKLIDDLWDCGLRPSEGSGSAGSLSATQKHLRDMKEIAFHVLKINMK